MGESPKPGDTHSHRYEIHKRVADRLRRTAGALSVEPAPSSMRPVRLEATIDTERFFGHATSVEAATLAFEWRPQSDRDEFRIQYNEPGTPWSCGWHQDDSHGDLGPSHFQVDHERWDTSAREPSSFTDPNPMAILETCLGELRDRVPGLPDSVR